MKSQISASEITRTLNSVSAVLDTVAPALFAKAAEAEAAIEISKVPKVQCYITTYGFPISSIMDAFIDEDTLLLDSSIVAVNKLPNWSKRITIDVHDTGTIEIAIQCAE